MSEPNKVLPYEELPPEQLYAWCLNKPDIVERYKGQIVILHGRSVLGGGRDALEALADAQRQAAEQHRSFPPRRELLWVDVPEQLWIDDDFSFPSSPAR